MGTRIEGAISKIKREAQRDGGKKAGRGRPKQEEKTGCGKLPQANPDDNKTRTDTAKAVGMKPRTYDKAKQVVESGNQAAIEQMNKTGKVDPAFRAVKREEKKSALRKKAAEVSEKVEKQPWRIILGDCFKELPKIKNASLIVADPPYNQGVDYGDDFDDEDEHVRLLCTVLRKSQEGDNLEGAAIFAYQLGRLIERASVLQHEPAALTGKKCRSGGAAGAQAKRLTPDEKQAKTDLYQAGLEALRKKHPNLKQEALIHKLARQLGQGHSVRTIKTYLPKSK